MYDDDTRGATANILSSDGTTITADSAGLGPTIILIGGEFSDRNSAVSGRGLATLLSRKFNVISYDRRGHGESGDAGSYAPQREVEDLSALITRFGGPASLFGHSSGAVLAVEAIVSGLNVERLALYEPPFAADTDWLRNGQMARDLTGLVSEGRQSDAAAHWMRETGIPSDHVELMKTEPFWSKFTKMAPTLIHELALLSEAAASLERVATFKNISVPVLAMAGERSSTKVRAMMDEIARVTPRGRYCEVAGFGHTARPEKLAPILADFFGAP